MSPARLTPIFLLAMTVVGAAPPPPEPTPDPGPLEATVLTDDDRSFLDANFQRFGSAWREGLAGLERDFELRAEANRASIVLGLTTRLPPQVGFRITVGREDGSMSTTDPMLPEAPALTEDEQRQVDAILRSEEVLWIVAPANGEVLRVDASRGSEALLHIERPWVTIHGRVPPPELETRRLGDRALLFVRMGYGDLFCLWIDLAARAVEGASWFEVPLRPARLLTPKDRAFLERALSENGDFGVYGNVTPGFAWLVEHFDVRVRVDDEGWHIRSDPRDGHGHFLHFTVEHETGRISDVIAGH